MNLKDKLQIKNLLRNRRFIVAVFFTVFSSLLIGGAGFVAKSVLELWPDPTISILCFIVLSVTVAFAVFFRNYSWGRFAIVWNQEIFDLFRQSMLTRLISDKNQVENLTALLMEKSYEFFFHHANACLRFSLVSLFSFVSIMGLNSAVALTSFLAMLSTAALIGLIFRLAVNSQNRFREAQLAFLSRLKQLIEGQENLLSLGKQGFVTSRFNLYLLHFLPRFESRVKQSSLLQAVAILIVLLALVFVGGVVVREVHDKPLGEILGIGLGLSAFVVSTVALVSIAPRALETWFELHDLVGRLNNCFDMFYHSDTAATSVEAGDNTLRVKILSKQFGERKFKLIDISFERGLTFVVGKNGSGKTSLLKCLAGLNRADEHEIFWGQQKLNTFDLQNLVTYLDADPCIFEGTALENLLLNDEKTKVEDIDTNLISVLGIEQELFEKMPENMSSGEKQLLNILRGIISQKPVLILDESLNSISERIQERIYEYLSTRSEKIVIVVTHSLSLVKGRIIQMNDPS